MERVGKSLDHRKSGACSSDLHLRNHIDAELGSFGKLLLRHLAPSSVRGDQLPKPLPKIVHLASPHDVEASRLAGVRDCIYYITTY